MSYLSAGDIAVLHEVLIGLANARLLEIATPGTLGVNGDPGTPVAVWTGSAEAFLERHDHDVLSGGAQVRVQATTLRVFDEAGATVALLRTGADWEAASVVVEDRRGVATVTKRWTIAGMEHESDQTLNSVLLTLNDERASA